ncbi:hypothetical protein STCU_03257 [Strigomonas culicis]|nr:hypothetical protein STCU_03257 [Strigomonas culicis]|eukprot:EPY31768.1 hypothetical protein STCU_03257 [Strigomonas culicis]
MASKRISHLVFRTPLLDYMTNAQNPTAAMLANAGGAAHNVEYLAQCPPEVQACLRNPEAVRMLVALRRAQVKSSMLKAHTLLSATHRESTWARAMGLM